jgi:hypothetical protein
MEVLIGFYSPMAMVSLSNVPVFVIWQFFLTKIKENSYQGCSNRVIYHQSSHMTFSSVQGISPYLWFNLT